MLVLEQLAAWLALLVEPDLAVYLWYKAESPVWVTFIYLCLFTFLTTIFYFWCIGEIKNSKRIRAVLAKIQGALSWLKIRLPFYRRVEREHENALSVTVDFLKKQGVVVIFLLSCVPIVPILPTAVVITTKILEIRHGLAIILIGTAIRNALVVMSFYNWIPWLLPFLK